MNECRCARGCTLALEAPPILQVTRSFFLVSAKLKCPNYKAHALWAFGGTSDKWQNSDLHRTVATVLEKFLSVPPERLRITRVQLYEILDHNSKVRGKRLSQHVLRRNGPSLQTGTTLSARNKEPRSPTNARSPTSPRSPKTFSPRGEKKEKKKSWSKSLDKKKANDLTAMKQKKLSTTDYTDNMLKILDDSETSSDVSGSSLIKDKHAEL